MLLILDGLGRETGALAHPKRSIITTRSFTMPNITEVNFDAGKLRYGVGSNVHDGHGCPIISMGHIFGSNSDPIVSTGHDPRLPANRYTITITATRDGHNKEWKGRIVAPDVSNPNGGWIFAVVATKNTASATDAGDGDIVITVTLTNPSGGQTPGYTPPPVPVASIP